MRVLILGGGGMLGHKLWQVFRQRFDSWVTFRSSAPGPGFFNPDRIRPGVDVFNFDSVAESVRDVRPNVIVNAIGVIKQRAAAKDPIISLNVNSLFPHRLAALSGAAGARLIHFSTDCVFSGKRGCYTERDTPDAEDLYGRSKLLGEVTRPGCLTLRTSIIGRELMGSTGLTEWFLSQRGGRVKGFTRAIFSGYPTLALAEIVARIIQEQPDLSGLYHVSSPPINKFDLLVQLRDAYEIPIEIEAVSEPEIDRSLDSTLFQRVTGWTPPGWPELVTAMVKDPTPYNALRTGLPEN